MTECDLMRTEVTMQVTFQRPRDSDKPMRSGQILSCDAFVSFTSTRSPQKVSLRLQFDPVSLPSQLSLPTDPADDVELLHDEL